MWKISNEVNKKILNSFRVEVINPLFEEIINYKKKYIIYNNILDYIDSSDIIYINKRKLYKTIFNRSKDKVKFYQYIEEFCKNSDRYILEQCIVYLFHNYCLDTGIYNIQKFEVNSNLKKIFINFFYEKFFSDSKIWEMINPKFANFNRIEFHKNFCNENNLTVCPYCDIDTLNNIGNREIEHFIPKSEYPFLSMHPYNLISSCGSCNKYEGKKTNYYTPIKSPFIIQIGDLVEFTVDDVNEIVKIKKSKIDYIDNYLKLLNLYERYQNKNVYETIDGRARSLYQIFLDSERDGNIIGKILFDKYLNQKKEPLTFALKSIYQSINMYTSYKNSLSS